MAHAKTQGPIQGYARCGLDAPYAEKREAARREIESSMAGRERPYGVARDDTAMKNPGGDLAAPAATPKRG
jgi:hypothetical protein